MKRIISFILISIVCLSLFPITSFADSPLSRTLPDYYFEDCPEHGNIEIIEYKEKEEMMVWTPYNYTNNIYYEIVLLMHGDGGSMHSWLDKVYNLWDKDIAGSNIFDWMAYEHVTVPFIIITLNNKPSNPDIMSQDIIDALLYITEHYSVYPKSSYDSLIENRNHITVGGLSRGSILTHNFMKYYPEAAGNYICMSASGPSYNAAKILKERNIRINKFFTAVGVSDDRFYEETKESYDVLKKYSDNSKYLEYIYAHNWCVWLCGIYDGLKFILPQYTINFKIIKHLIDIREKL